MKVLIKILTLSIAALVLFACSKNSSNSNSFTLADFKGSSWEMVYAASPEGVSVPNDNSRPVHITFIETNRIAGMGGVNRFNGPIMLTEKGGGNFGADVKMVASTMMAGKFLPFEQFFFKSLEAADTIKISGATMELSSDGKVLLKFKRNDSTK